MIQCIFYHHHCHWGDQFLLFYSLRIYLIDIALLYYTCYAIIATSLLTTICKNSRLLYQQLLYNIYSPTIYNIDDTFITVLQYLKSAFDVLSV